MYSYWLNTYFNTKNNILINIPGHIKFMKKYKSFFLFS